MNSNLFINQAGELHSSTLLYNVKLFHNSLKVYDENLPFNSLNSGIEDNIKDFIRFIRPLLQYDYIDTTYIRDLQLNEI